jgi:hypothetical protein
MFSSTLLENYKAAILIRKMLTESLLCPLTLKKHSENHLRHVRTVHFEGFFSFDEG